MINAGVLSDLSNCNMIDQLLDYMAWTRSKMGWSKIL